MALRQNCRLTSFGKALDESDRYFNALNDERKRANEAERLLREKDERVEKVQLAFTIWRKSSFKRGPFLVLEKAILALSVRDDTEKARRG